MKLAGPLIVAVLTLAALVSVPVALAATNGTAPQQETAATAGEDPARVEASLALDRPTRRLIQQGLRNEGFDPGTPDGLFGPRTRAAIRDWQQSRGASPAGYLNSADAELLRRSAAAPPTSTPAETDANPAPVTVATEVPQNVPETNTQQWPRDATGPGTTQLPPEILIDRHLVRAERLLRDGDPVAALEAMNEVLALQQEHDLVLPDAFNFEYAQVAYAAGRTEAAIAWLNQYLAAAGRQGAFYREALELLDSADVRREQEAAERRTAEAARRRAEAERQRAGRWPPGHVFRDCEMCPAMVVLPGSIVALGRYEVMLGEYRAFAATTGAGAATGCLGMSYTDGTDSERSWRNPGFSQTDRHPVTCVSLDDAQAYLSWLSRTSGVPYRLPTWAELVRAAEGSQPGCHRDRQGRDGTCPVGTYGSSPLGLSDMLGNVWEWASDCWEGDCSRRVTHGHSWPARTRFLVPNWFGTTSPPDARDHATGVRGPRTLQ